MPSANDIWNHLSNLATRGPLVLPIWAAGLFILLFFIRGPLLALFFRLFGGKDALLEKSILSKIDIPVQLLLLTLAILPFTFYIMPPYGNIVGSVTHLMVLVLLFHIIIQAVDLAVFSWYLHQRGANVSAVVRFFVLSIMYGIAFLLLLDWGLGVSILPLLATSTILTAVFGLAMQDTLKNAFAGLNMSVEQSFREGDWVMFRLDANESWYGQIVEIGWRTTKIRTLNNNYALIPNAKFTMHELINFNRPTPQHGRTIELPVNLKADPAQVRSALTAAAREATGVEKEPQPQATPLELKSTHAVVQLRFWIESIEQRELVTGDVVERCWEALAAMGALPDR